MKKILALILALWPGIAWAQCSGVFPSNTVCANLSASPSTPTAVPFGGTIIGPGSTTVNDFVLWNSTVGTSIKDAGFTTGASGHAIPFLDGTNTWSGTPTTFSSAGNDNLVVLDTASGRQVTLSTNQSSNPAIVLHTTGTDAQLNNSGTLAQIFYNSSANLGINTSGALSLDNQFGTSGQCPLSSGSASATVWATCPTWKVINATTFVCDGATDNAPALNTLLGQAGAANGMIIQLPPSTFASPCLLGSGFTYTGGPLWIRGSGRGRTWIEVNFNGDVWTFGTTATSVSAIKVSDIAATSTINRSSGAILIARNGGDVIFDSVECYNGTYVCTGLDGGASQFHYVVNEPYFLGNGTTDYRGVWIGYGGHLVQDAWIINGGMAGYTESAIYCENGSGIYINGPTSTLNNAKGLETFPASGEVCKGFMIHDLLVDTNTLEGMCICENGGAVTDWQVTNLWASSNGSAHTAGQTDGLLILLQNGGKISGLNFANCKLIANAGNGVSISGGDHYSFAGCGVEANGQQTTNTYSGYNLLAGTHIQITGGWAGSGGTFATNPQKYGILITSADYVACYGNDTQGNQTGGISGTPTHNLCTTTNNF